MKRARASMGLGPKAWGVSLLLLVAACQREGSEERVASAPTASPAIASSAVGVAPAPEAEATRSWLRELQVAHRAADDARDPTSRKAALELLTDLYQRGDTLPRAVEEIVQLRQDIAVRAARLALASSDEMAALAWVERGLDLSGEPSVLAATLWMVAADAHEARGDLADARRALQQALAINQQLLDRELEDP